MKYVTNWIYETHKQMYNLKWERDLFAYTDH